MHLSAAIIPPQDAAEELWRAVRSVVPGSTSRGHRGPRRRLLQRAAPAEPEVQQAQRQLDIVPPARMSIPLVTFGNLSTLDVRRLCELLAEQAGTWEPATVRFSGSAALEWPGDIAVWSRLAGDVTRLDAIGKGVPLVAQELGLFVDRRKFRPWITVGTITDYTDATYLEELVARLDRFSGHAWPVQEIVMLKGRDPRQSDTLQEYARIPIGS